MTWVTDGSGTRLVPTKPRKRRAPSTPRRFGDLQEGAVLIFRGRHQWDEGVKHDRPVANEDLRRVRHEWVGLAIVTDRWFDPVAGQHDRWKGEMAGLKALNANGLGPNKTPHTLRGLAQQGYHPTTPEQAERVSRWLADRTQLLLEFDAGRITLEEARLRAYPWIQLLRDLGLDAGPPPDAGAKGPSPPGDSR